MQRKIEILNALVGDDIEKKKLFFDLMALVTAATLKTLDRHMGIPSKLSVNSFTSAELLANFHMILMQEMEANVQRTTDKEARIYFDGLQVTREQITAAAKRITPKNPTDN